MSKKSKILQYFGWGLFGYALGLFSWTLIVLTKPANLKPLILIGVIPFLLAHLAYAKAAAKKYPKMASAITTLTVVLLLATFLARTFFYKSDPYFSSKGLLFFGLKPVPTALYIATISVSFLPAIQAVASEIKQATLKSIMAIGLTILYVNAIILVSAQDNTLLLMNGVVLSLTLLTLWIKALMSPAKA